MDPALRRLFREDAGLHAVGEGLWSALAPGGRAERYDELAAGYDRLIGSRLYQRLAWGNDPDDDVRFAREAASSASGPLLDVGCGSLLFTADVHARSGRTSLLLDLSLGMLRRGRARLLGPGEDVPGHLALVQADAFALPLRPRCADTIMCLGILHLFEDPTGLLRSLASLLAPGGRLFVSSLVTDRAFGRAYLRVLARSGEVKGLRSADELTALVARATGLRTLGRRRGNMVWLESDPRAASDPTTAAPPGSGAAATRP